MLREIQPRLKSPKTVWADDDTFACRKRIPIINTIELYHIVWFSADVGLTFLAGLLMPCVFQFIFIHPYSPSFFPLNEFLLRKGTYWLKEVGRKEKTGIPLSATQKGFLRSHSVKKSIIPFGRRVDPISLRWEIK